jgi:hypothetical protein
MKESKISEDSFITIPLTHVSFIASFCCSMCKMKAMAQSSIHHTLLLMSESVDVHYEVIIYSVGTHSQT